MIRDYEKPLKIIGWMLFSNIEIMHILKRLILKAMEVLENPDLAMILYSGLVIVSQIFGLNQL